MRAPDEFCDAVWLEDGLAKNTLESYRRDLSLFADCTNARACVARARTEADLAEYFAWRYRGALREEARYPLEHPGAAALELKALLPVSRPRAAHRDRSHAQARSPKKPPRFPKTLSEVDVEALARAA